MRDVIQESSLFARFALLVGVGPLLVAVLYLWRPSERRLAYMRPVSLAAIFAGLGSLLGGLMSILRAVGASGPINLARLYPGLAEACAPSFLICAVLTLSWLLIALGMRREPA